MYDLYIFDKDQTLVNPFDAWAQASIKAIDEVTHIRAQARGLGHNAVLNHTFNQYNEKREATQNGNTPFKIYTWYWDFSKFIENIDILQPNGDKEKEYFDYFDKRICLNHDAQRLSGLKTFDGIDDVLKTLNQKAKLAMFTDNRIKDVQHAFQATALDIGLFSAINCQVNEDNQPYHFNFDGMTYLYQGKKPQPRSIDAAIAMIEHFRENQTQLTVAIIGDNKNDAGAYKTLKQRYQGTSVCFDFIWAKYGADLASETIEFCNGRLNDPYRLGVENNKNEIQAMGITPDYILEKPMDILNARPQ